MFEVRVKKNWAEDLIKNLPKFVKRGDTVNIWGLPSVGRLGQIELIRESLDDGMRSVFLKTNQLTDISAENFFGLLGSELRNLLREQSQDSGSLSNMMLSEKLLNKVTEEYELCIIVDSLEHLTSLDPKFFEALKAMRDKFLGSLNFMFLSVRPVHEHPAYMDNKETVDFMSYQIVNAETYTDDEMRDLVKQSLDFYEIELSKKNVEKVVYLSGGILGLMKHILRYLEIKDNENFEIKELLINPSIKNRLERIYGSFTSEEQKFIRDLLNDKDPTIIDSYYLNNSGILCEDGICSDLLKEFILNQDDVNAEFNVVGQKSDPDYESSLVINHTTGEIIKKGVRLSEILSEKELDIIRYLYENIETIVTRDELAEIMWGDQKTDKYSDWAIDKAISRIRKKIRDTERPYKHLITIKGKGFKLYTD